MTELGTAHWLECDQCKRRLLLPAPFALTLDDEAGYTFCGRACLAAWLDHWYPRSAACPRCGGPVNARGMCVDPVPPP